MKGPSTGYYWIRLVQLPKPFAGVDHPTPGSRVITAGRDNVWRVTELGNGTYTIALKSHEDNLFVQDEETLNVGPIPYAWVINKVEGHYVIEVPSMIRPPRGWTVRNTAPKEPVTVNVYEFPRPNHMWDFIVWPGPEAQGSKSVAKR